MKHLFLLIICLAIFKLAAAQKTIDTLNFGFENQTGSAGFADRWMKMPRKSNFTFKLDSNTKHSGRYALLIEESNPSDQIFGCAARKLQHISGKEIEVRAYMKLENITGVMGLMLRIDGKDSILAFDNMERKRIRGTINWRQYSVKLAIPEGAETVYVGGILSGTGKLWLDDFEVLVDGNAIR
ncbi:hypothetical protein [Mucilaginibacter sp. BT774]|uniref:hypothetical protein n=1 Tax=Mucilaginibacter sp. BT774 TaxID=3062276 RepID=UPI002676F7C0|nr:hypothetical protein [Mucilaginibacter sp. BT774]MDO3627171.1 hypothetical protein [Mucilaginibacter sp. BT774]